MIEEYWTVISRKHFVETDVPSIQQGTLYGKMKEYCDKYGLLETKYDRETSEYKVKFKDQESMINYCMKFL